MAVFIGAMGVADLAVAAFRFPGSIMGWFVPSKPASIIMVSGNKEKGVLASWRSSFPLDDLVHGRIVYARFPRDGCHSVTVFQALPAHGGIARRFVLLHAG